MKTSRLALGANPCGIAHPCAAASTRSAPSGRGLSHLVAVVLFLAFIGQAAIANTVNLQWDPNPEPDIAGYKLSYGTSPGVYSNSITTECCTATTVSGLVEGQNYYFVLKAVNTAGLESAPSAEVSYLVPLPPNTAPVAADDTVNTNEDQTVALTLSATDAEGNALSYLIVGGPSMGTLSGSAPNLTYTPKADANGTDSFTFVANDGNSDSNTATVSITVISVNDAPVAVAQKISTPEDKALGIFLSANDKDGDALNYSIVSSPTKGILSGTAPNLTYVPNPNANGQDSFAFLANDGTNDSNTATVSISITPVNDAPVAAAQLVAATAGVPVSIVLSAKDQDGDPLTFSIVGVPAQGILTGNPPNLTYTANTDASGTDLLAFHANDGKVNSNTATIAISITAAEKTENKAPVFQSDLITRASGITGDAYVAESLAGSAVDPDGDALIYSKASGPEWLSISPNGEITGTPPSGAEGLNSFTIRSSDKDGAFDEAVLEITILAAELPLPWNLARIGTVSEESSAWGDSSFLKAKSTGSLTGTNDDGLFLWQTLGQDGKIIARIDALQNSIGNSRIGLEIRDSLAPNSKHVFIGTDGSGSLRFVRRTKTGGNTATSNAGSGSAPNLWLRLARNGDSILASTSTDGSNWTRVGKISITLESSAYIGLMVSGGEDNLSSAVFKDVSARP
jgi:hypothetical protein